MNYVTPNRRFITNLIKLSDVSFKLKTETTNFRLIESEFSIEAAFSGDVL